MYYNAALAKNSKSVTLDTVAQPSSGVVESPAINAAARRADEMFREAVQDGWNREIDWLWLATKVTLDSQKIYCLEQALSINPANRQTKVALKRLRK